MAEKQVNTILLYPRLSVEELGTIQIGFSENIIFSVPSWVQIQDGGYPNRSTFTGDDDGS